LEPGTKSRPVIAPYEIPWGGGSVGGLRRCGGPHQPIAFHQDMTLFVLRPQKAAYTNEDGGKQQADDHDASIGLAVDSVKRRDHECEAVVSLDPYSNSRPAQRKLRFNVIEWSYQTREITEKLIQILGASLDRHAGSQEDIGELIERIKNFDARNDDGRNHQIEAEMHCSHCSKAFLRPAHRCEGPWTKLMSY
jgi:hypothetical protein